MEEYVYFEGKKLRKGYTTGTCATAASTAATLLLVAGERKEEIIVRTPSEKQLRIPIARLEEGADYAIAAVKKDGGDDADATHGLLIYAKITRTVDTEIHLDGGVGIGRVTQEGLLVPVGEAAINPVPRRMIIESVRQVIGAEQGVNILIYAPEGEVRARQTMNSNLGILGGISILGTTGIVTPMSEEGWKSAISIELEMKRKQGYTKIVLSPGNYGEDFAVNQLKIAKKTIVSMSNFVGYVLKEVQRLAFEEVLIVGHLGKLIKVSAGIFSTHSKDADARTEILVANLALLGMPIEGLEKVEKCNTTEAAGDIIEELGYQQVYQVIADKIKKRSERILHFRKPQVKIETVLFSSKRGFLAATKPLTEIMEEWQ